MKNYKIGFDYLFEELKEPASIPPASS